MVASNTLVVNAKHFSMINITKSSRSKMQMVVWESSFANEGLSKLVKAINLTTDFWIPLDKNEPWTKLQRDLHGVEVYIRIENDKGKHGSSVRKRRTVWGVYKNWKWQKKQCVDCPCDLEGNHHVFDEGEYRCEEHNMQRVPLLYATCTICFQYAERRTRTFFQNPVLETL